MSLNIYFIDCSGNYGWKTVSGDRVAYWGGNTGNEGCTGGQCECNNGGSSDAGELTDKDVCTTTCIRPFSQHDGLLSDQIYNNMYGI